MPDTFDAYRESLVMETSTVWPEEYDEMEREEKERIAQALHADPESCAHIDYVRVHTGFCRQITVTAEDIERVA